MTILCLISSPPDSQAAKRGLDLAGEWVKQGHMVQICALQDGIYHTLPGIGSADDKTLRTVDWLVLSDDLLLRGFTGEDTRPGVKKIDYPELMEIMLNQADRVLGAF